MSAAVGLIASCCACASSYVTPSSFSDFLSVLSRLLVERSRALSDEHERFTAGVDRLDNLSESVAKMRISVSHCTR